MKKRTSFFVVGAFLSLLAALLLFTCAKDDTTLQAPQDDLSTQNLDIPEIPADMAKYLTEEEIGDFYARKPSFTPASNDVTERDKRPKKWRPFFGWGDITAAFLPVLSNCTTPATAEICYNHADCPEVNVGPPILPPFRGGGGGEGHMTGYGQVWNTWLRFSCGGGFERVNGTYEKDEHILQYRTYSPPTVSFEDGYLVLEYDIKVCNANEGDPMCWSYSMGDFDDSEGILRQRLGAKLPAPGSPPRKMFDENEGYIITWGWLWY